MKNWQEGTIIYETQLHSNHDKCFSDIIDYYTTRETADKQALAKGELSPWLLLVKPFNATFPVEDGVQEKMLQAVLHARRIETVFSGLRWLDVRRFGIEVVHNVEEKEPVVLPAEDLRRVIQLPQAVTAAGLPANPRWFSINNLKKNK